MTKIRQGGLFRCCTQTAAEYGDGTEGERLACRFCKRETMRFRDGAWEWVGMDGPEAKLFSSN